MKKLILSIFVILFLYAFNSDAIVIMRTRGTGCVPQAKITFWWECESTTAEYSAGDSTATPVGSPALNATAKKSGTNGLDAPATGSYYRFDGMTGVWGSEARVGFWTYVNSGIGTNAPRIFLIEIAGSTPAISFQFKSVVSPVTKLFWNNPTSADISLESGSACVTTGAWFWIEFWYDDSDDSIGFVVYDSNLDKVSEADCDEATTGTFDALGTPDDTLIGSTQTSGDLYIDHIIVINDHDHSLLSCANESSYPY